MQNLAYQLDLTSLDVEAISWQSWQIFRDALGMSNVEIVCGDCGEYLSRFFASKEWSVRTASFPFEK